MNEGVSEFLSPIPIASFWKNPYYCHFSLISHSSDVRYLLIPFTNSTSDLQISSQYLGVSQKLFNINSALGGDRGHFFFKVLEMFSRTPCHLNDFYFKMRAAGMFYSLVPQPSFIPQTVADRTHKGHASSDVVVVHTDPGDAPSPPPQMWSPCARMNILFDLTLFSKSKVFDFFVGMTGMLLS